LINPLP